MTTIAIVGGAGKLGSWYAGFFKTKGFDVIISDLNQEEGERKGKTVGVKFEVDNKNAVRNADIIIISVPVKSVPTVIDDIISCLRNKSLIVDFASVKYEACRTLEKYKNLDIEIASIHPMHSEKIRSLGRWPVVFIPIKPGRLYKEMKDIFIAENAKVLESNAIEHDKIMSVVQGVPHTLAFIGAHLIKNLKYDFRRTYDFASPNYLLFISSMVRVLNNAELSANIQLENPENTKIREILGESYNILLNLSKSNDIKILSQEIAKSARVFPHRDFMDLLNNVSQKAVDAFNLEYKELNSLIGKKIAVKKLQKNIIHYGLLDNIAADELILIERGKKINIRIDNIKLLSADETLKWRSDNLELKERYYSFIVPRFCDSHIIIESMKSNGIHSIEIVDDQFPIDDFNKSITIGAKIYGDENIEYIDQDIKRHIQGLGYTLRGD